MINYRNFGELLSLYGKCHYATIDAEQQTDDSMMTCVVK